MKASGAEVARRKTWTLAFLLGATAFLIRVPYYSDALHVSDSAHYLMAARAGSAAHWAGTGSISLWTFGKRFTQDREFRKHPWASLLREHDLHALRHFHGPVGFYPHAWVTRLGGGNRAQRVLVGVEAAGLTATASLVLLAMGVPAGLALACGVAVATIPAGLWGTTQISPHFVYITAAVIFLYFLGKTVERRQLQGKGLAVAGAVATASLELAIMLAATAAFLLTFDASFRTAVKAAVQDGGLWRCIGLYVLCLFVLWPAGVLEGGYLLSYGTLVFQALFRRESFFGAPDPVLWMQRLGGGNWIAGAAFTVFTLVALVASFRWCLSGWAKVFTIYLVLALLQGFANNFQSPFYVVEFEVFMWMAAGLLMVELAAKTGSSARWWGRNGWVVVLGLAGALHWQAVVQPQDRDRQTSRRVAVALEALRARFKRGTKFVVNKHHEPMNAYAPEYWFEAGVWKEGKLVPQGLEAESLVELVSMEDLPEKQREESRKGGRMCQLGDSGFAAACEFLGNK